MMSSSEPCHPQVDAQFEIQVVADVCTALLLQTGRSVPADLQRCTRRVLFQTVSPGSVIVTLDVQPPDAEDDAFNGTAANDLGMY